MSDPTSPVTIGASRVLSAHLSAPGWCKDDLVKAYRASSLSRRLRNQTPGNAPAVRNQQAPTDEETKAFREWLDTPVEAIVLNERERELSREAIGHFARAAQLQLNDDLVALMDAIGMKPEAV